MTDKRDIFRPFQSTVVAGRVYRKSDQHYWTFEVRCHSDPLIALRDVKVWAEGLAVHPNLDCVTIESLVDAGVQHSFDYYRETLRNFLDDAV